MKNKFISSLLVICCLLGLISLPVQASTVSEEVDPIANPVQVQDLTGARFESDVLTVADGDLLYYSENGKSGLLDVFGNTVLPPLYSTVYSLGDGYFGVERDGKRAMFYRGTQLTEFREDYMLFSRMLFCFRAELNTEKYEFLNNNGKQISIPNVANGEWKVIDIIPGKAILLYKPAKYWYDESTFDGIVHTNPKYRITDWNGNEIERETDRTLSFRDENSYSVSGGYIHEYRYLTGGVVPGPPEGYSSELGMYFSDSQYIILVRGSMDEKTFYLFDRDYNLICQLDAYPNSIYPVVPLTETTFLVRNPQEYTVVMNAEGDVLAELPGTFSTYVGIEDDTNMSAPLDRFITCDGQNCYLYDKEAKLIATLEGVTRPENNGYYITVELEDSRYGLYDFDGTFLFEYNRDSEIEIRKGVILQEKNGKTAVLDRKGNPLTDYHFKLCQNTGVYGLIYTTVSGRDGFFLVNAAGQILHSEGFDGVPHVSGSYCVYKIDGKSGVLRVVRPEDTLFVDVPRGTWYYDSVETCAQMALFNGTAPARFSPESPMTRAMLVTVLWRLEGEPAAEGTETFTDVPRNTWYSRAVAWASENRIVNGVGGDRFDPDGNITREQIATILYRYAQTKNVDTGGSADLSTYPDSDQVNSYALAPMVWANAAGLINGIKSGSTVTLQPQANATRAQVATILIRYIENIVAK